MKKYPLAALALLLSSTVLAADEPLKPVQIAAVTSTIIAPTVKLLGTVESRSEVAITAGVNGQLTWVVEPGRFVAAGETLVTMDTFPLELAQLEQQAKIKRERINLRFLKRELERLETLQADNNAAEYQLDENRAKFELASADLEIAQLKLKQINDELARANVKAPFAGVITERLHRAGTDVNRAETLLRLLDTEHLEVHLFVPVKYLSKIRKGEALLVLGEQYQAEAAISAVIPAADRRSQTFELRLSLDDRAIAHWTSGQLVKVAIPVNDASQALTVPRDALILRRQGAFVMRIDSDNIAHKLPVTVGDGQGDRIAISGELQEGDSVAIRGAERLKDGQKVTVQGAS
ncbi:efflux RND transporter periplasmic adaptor subunit [uncultured Ferrimonas sp.]|uniref:efflux RND transporter periplasmic adaptor subunit n=1 Tax=uncultured Ferrimonas sp. TaxID=432640 RepID=UPI002618DC53|nr:efflux RND transporter periplasmic adaptor subunit [uncultured Ferrimonas sp.]